MWAPRGRAIRIAVCDVVSWPESAERVVGRAVISLLPRHRFFGVPEDHRSAPVSTQDALLETDASAPEPAHGGGHLVSDPSEPEPKQPPDDEEDDWRFEFELRDLPDLGGLRERGPVDAGEINDLGTGDDPPRSGE